jgi:hypothetical protein
MAVEVAELVLAVEAPTAGVRPEPLQPRPVLAVVQASAPSAAHRSEQPPPLVLRVAAEALPHPRSEE